jgi:uncharacterized protein YbjT (DUF2867 family)
MTDAPVTIAVLGASGLIGAAVAEHLLGQGFRTVPVARRLTGAQAALFGEAALTCPIGEASVADLADLLRDRGVDVVVNCLGVLQDGPRGRTADIHEAFVARLLAAIRAQARPVLLVHLSVPGRAAEDATDFSRTKRSGERLIAAAELPSVVLRPGFVVAPAAYGGSALLRALAALPVTLPPSLGARPFAATAIDDIAETVALLARRWAAGERRWKAVWDLCESPPATVAATLDAVRARFGGPRPRVRVPAWLLRVGAGAGDAAAWLGWAPPIRTTALREMLRGVEGSPEAWIAATGREPASLDAALRRLPSSVQERWFARLYLLKALIVGVLAVFWVASGGIALTTAFRAASAILTAHGFAAGPADLITAVSSLVDIGVGLAIAVRRTCRAGLVAGIAVSLAYMAGAAILTPDLWAEPLGALVKTGPAIVLMVVALAILEAR